MAMDFRCAVHFEAMDSMGKMAPQQPLKPGMTRDDLVRYENGRF